MNDGENRKAAERGADGKKNKVNTGVINLNVSNDDGFLSPYSFEGTPVISSEVADFLENAVKAHSPKEKLILNVKGDCIDENERVQYAAAIKNYYSLKLKEEERERKNRTKVAAIFALIGIIALAFMFYLSEREVSEIWKECIDIFAWVFLWEAVDQFFIERGAVKIRRKRYLNFAEMEIRFE